LIQFFRDWVSGWISNARECRRQIETKEAEFDRFLGSVKTFLGNDVAGPSLPVWPKTRDLSQNCDFNALLSNFDIPKRSEPKASLGVPLGTLSGWLLDVRSPELVLITGLIGFGLFGALASSSIRPASAGDRGPARAFVRGISAAVLVYLAAVGGLAVFARDASPNPYSVYFACFVAAVFSEDVWQWARRQQRNSLRPVTRARARPPRPTSG
jgi:hypothetical protein